MNVKPINSAADHTAALEELGLLLIDPDQNLDHVEVLSSLIENYERKIVSIEAPSPHEAIRFRMEQLGLRNRDLEPILGSRSKVSEILSGKRPLSLDMVRDLHRIYGIPLQALIQKVERVPETLKALSKLVMDRLETYGVGFKRSKPEKFLADAFGDGRAYQLLRKTRTTRANERTDDTALLYWQAAVLNKAKGITTKGKFKQSRLTNNALRKIAKLSTESDPIMRAAEQLSEWGIILVYLQTLPGTYLDGAAMLDKRGRPVIGLTGRHDRTDNFWFSLLHEISHLARHLDILKPGKEAFFDDLEFKSEDERETEADELARDSLIPQACIELVDWGEFCSTEDIEAVAEAADVHVSIAAGRWQREHANYKKFSRLIERKTVRSALARI